MRTAIRTFFLALAAALSFSGAAQAQFSGGNFVADVVPNCISYQVAGGTSDAIVTGQLTNPSLACPANRTLLILYVTATNLTTTPTLRPLLNTAQIIVNSNGTPLTAAEMVTGSVVGLINDGLHWRLVFNGAGSGGGGGGGFTLNLTPATPDIFINPSNNCAGGACSVGTQIALNVVPDATYTVLDTDIAKIVQRTNASAQTDVVPQAVGNFGLGAGFSVQTATASDTLTPAGGSTVNGLSSVLMGPRQLADWYSDGTNWWAGLYVPQPVTQTGTNFLRDDMTWGQPPGTNCTLFQDGGIMYWNGGCGEDQPLLNWNLTHLYATIVGTDDTLGINRRALLLVGGNNNESGALEIRGQDTTNLTAQHGYFQIGVHDESPRAVVYLAAGDKSVNDAADIRIGNQTSFSRVGINNVEHSPLINSYSAYFQIWAPRNVPEWWLELRDQNFLQYGGLEYIAGSGFSGGYAAALTLFDDGDVPTIPQLHLSPVVGDQSWISSKLIIGGKTAPINTSLYVNGDITGSNITNCTVTGTDANGTLECSSVAGTGTVTSVALAMPAIFSVAGSPISTSGTLSVTANGTGGGIPWFNGASALASTAQLHANGFVIGGGASAPSSIIACGNGQIPIGQGAGVPACANITSTGATITITNMANSINLEATNAASAMTSVTGDCTGSGPGATAVTCIKTSGTNFGYFATGTDASNLTGSAPLSVIGTGAANHAVPVDVGGTSTYKVITNCTDTGGNHLNYTQSTDSFSCGTSNSGAGITALTGDVTASGSGSVAATLVTSLTHSWTGSQRGTPVNIAISTATFTPNFDTGQNFEVDLTSACPCTLANPSTTLVAGQSGMFEIHQDGSGSRTIGTWGTDYLYVGGTSTITLSTPASSVDYIAYYVNNAATGIVLGSIIKAPSH